MHSRLPVFFLLACLAPGATAGAGDEVDSLVARKSAIINSMHRKARKALVNAAQDKAFVEYYAAHDDGHRHSAKQKIDRISLKVQSRFNVEEMCLIDANGAEISRIVGDAIAHDLSPDESGATFFDPAFRLEPRRVLTSRIYLSPDADKWVVAFVTPIAHDERNKALLHYEHGLDVYHTALNKGLEGDRTFLLAVDEDGLVVSDSRASIDIARSGDREAARDYFARFELGGRSLEEVLASIETGEPVIGKDGRRYRGATARAGRWTLLAFRELDT